MKRLSLLGLCLVASLAFSALGASGAMAKKAEHGELMLLSSGGASHLGTPKATIDSSSNDSVTHITSATAGTLRTTFRGVESEIGHLKCHSEGKPAGVIETNLLTEETGWISKAKNEAGVDFKPASGEFTVQFECEGGLLVKVRGSVIGHITPLNASALSDELNLIQNATGKENSPESFEGGPKDIIESELSSAPGVFSPSVQVQEHVNVTNHGNSSVCKLKKGVEKCKPAPTEFYTKAGPAPQFGRCVKKGAGIKYVDANCTTEGAKGKYGFVPVPG